MSDHATNSKKIRRSNVSLSLQKLVVETKKCTFCEGTLNLEQCCVCGEFKVHMACSIKKFEINIHNHIWCSEKCYGKGKKTKNKKLKKKKDTRWLKIFKKF